MKISLLLILTMIFQLQAETGYAQKAKITLNKTNASVLEIINEIESVSEFKFFYSEDELDLNRRLTIKVREQQIGNILKNLFVKGTVKYKVVDRHIIITSSDEEDFKESKEPINKSEVLKELDQFLVSGNVTDANGSPLPGANIVEKGTTNGVQTDFDGNFSIEVADENAVLVISYIGFATKEVGSRGQTDLGIVLEESSSSLDEVVVIGYGTAKKSDVTGAISSLGDDDFNKGAISSPDQLFQGKAAGVQVIQNSGEPGGGISINIRGSGSINAGTSPLYVIDGLPIDNSPVFDDSGRNVPLSRTPRNPLSSINPNDIESIEILKDASATAIYGSRGANGVVIITTKSGKTGKLKISYDASFGVQNVAHKLDLLDAMQYRQTINSIIDEGGAPESQRVTEIQNGGTDWQDEIYVQNALVNSHNITVSGGGETDNYLFSINRFHQEGLVIGSDFERYTARMNINSEISEKFKTGINISTTYSTDSFAPTGFSTNQNAGAINAALYYDPTIQVRNENGEFQRSPFITVDNPLALATGIMSVGATYRTLGTVYGEYYFLPELTFRLNLGADISSKSRDSYVGRETAIGNSFGGVGTRIEGRSINYLAEGTLNYSKIFGDHTINAVVGVTTQTFRSSILSGNAIGFPSDATLASNLGLGDPSSSGVSSGAAKNTLLSYLGRINYGLMDKYLFTASFRIDGSSRFGENNKYGYFPSFALGWKIDNEKFFEPLSKDFSQLKLRASWGQTGNQEIGNLNSQLTLGAGEFTIIGGDFVSTVQPNRIANPNLKWETTTQFNIGLDYGLWKNRISGAIDYFRKKTTDLLLNLPVPTSSGFDSVLSNVGSVQNKGFEFSISSNNLVGEFQWKTQGNFTTLKNEVLSLGDIEQIIQGSASFANQIFLTEKGKSLGSFYGYKTEGIWQIDDDFSQTNDQVVPGDIKYSDINGDNIVNAEDRVVLGKSIPDFIWSITNSFNYKNFGLNIFFEGTSGVSMLNNNLVDTYFPIDIRRNRFAEPLINRWTPENPSNTFPSFVNTNNQGPKGVNSITVEDASYVRLQTVTLTYELPIKKDFLSSVTLSLTGQNLYLWSDYSGYDPGLNPNGNITNRIDYNAYPMPRTYSLGLNVNF